MEISKKAQISKFGKEESKIEDDVDEEESKKRK
jgi:hypothetical protein